MYGCFLIFWSSISSFGSSFRQDTEAANILSLSKYNMLPKTFFEDIYIH